MGGLFQQQTTSSLLLTFVHSNTTDTNMPTSELNFTTLQTYTEDGDFFDPFNNPWNLITASTRKQLMRLIAYLYILLLAVGVPANVINCLVFYKQVSTAVGQIVEVFCYCCACVLLLGFRVICLLLRMLLPLLPRMMSQNNLPCQEYV